MFFFLKRDNLEFVWDCLNQDIYIMKFSLFQSKVPCLKHRTQKNDFRNCFLIFLKVDMTNTILDAPKKSHIITYLVDALGKFCQSSTGTTFSPLPVSAVMYHLW